MRACRASIRWAPIRWAPIRREGAVQDFIHRKNLVHYRKLLAGSTLDDATRNFVCKLLADEELNEPPLPVTPDDDPA